MDNLAPSNFVFMFNFDTDSVTSNEFQTACLMYKVMNNLAPSNFVFTFNFNSDIVTSNEFQI